MILAEDVADEEKPPEAAPEAVEHGAEGEEVAVDEAVGEEAEPEESKYPFKMVALYFKNLEVWIWLNHDLTFGVRLILFLQWTCIVSKRTTTNILQFI